MEALKPIIDLPLEEITDGKTPDSSANQLNVTVFGNAQIVPDDQFGSCLLLADKDAGLSLGFPGLNSGQVSVTSWYKGTQASQVLLALNDATGKVILQVDSNNDGMGGLSAGSDQLVSKVVITDNAWHFLAISTTDDQVLLYVDGLLAVTLDTTIDIASIKNLQINCLGTYARLKAFDGAITQTAILEEQQAGVSTGHIFKNTYPLDFEFIDDQVKNVFYIVNLDQGKDQTIEWQVQNTSTQQIILNPLTDASVQNYHFEIRFRPQTFKDNSIRVSRIAENWLASEAILNSNNTISLFFSYTGSGAYTLDSGAMIDFGLSYRSAFGQLGGRGSHTLISYQNLHYPDNSTQITGSRVKQIDIVNQRGKKNLPLHIGFIGSNTILNDADPGSRQGTKNNLRFRLINAMNDSPLTFNSTQNTPDPTKQTRLTLSFDSMEERRLASDDELMGITVRTAGNWATVTQKSQGKMPLFIIDAFTVDALPAATALDILIENIITSQSSGITNLYINYQNMPGYWDGEIILEVEKTPIIHRNFNTGKHVGIGVEPHENYQMKVGGNLRLEPDSGDQEMFVIGSKDQNTDFFKIDQQGHVGVGKMAKDAQVQHELVVDGAIKIGKEIIPSAENGPNNGIVFPPNPGGGSGDIASIKYYAQSGESTVLELLTANDPDDHIALNPSGNVGIGTTSPEQKLDVQGNARFSGSLDTNSVQTENILVNGKLGIGNKNPEDQLDIEGNIRSTGKGTFGSMHVNGDITVGDNAPFLLVRYEQLGDNINYDTGYEVDQWNASIAGFNCRGADINELGSGDPIKMYMYVKDNNWWIRADFWSHNDHENWDVDVLFIRTNVSKRSGY